MSHQPLQRRFLRRASVLVVLVVLVIAVPLASITTGGRSTTTVKA